LGRAGDPAGVREAIVELRAEFAAVMSYLGAARG